MAAPHGCGHFWRLACVVAPLTRFPLSILSLRLSVPLFLSFCCPFSLLCSLSLSLLFLYLTLSLCLSVPLSLSLSVALFHSFALSLSSLSPSYSFSLCTYLYFFGAETPCLRAVWKQPTDSPLTGPKSSSRLTLLSENGFRLGNRRSEKDRTSTWEKGRGAERKLRLSVDHLHVKPQLLLKVMVATDTVKHVLILWGSCGATYETETIDVLWNASSIFCKISAVFGFRFEMYTDSHV